MKSIYKFVTLKKLIICEMSLDFFHEEYAFVLTRNFYSEIINFLNNFLITKMLAYEEIYNYAYIPDCDRDVCCECAKTGYNR